MARLVVPNTATLFRVWYGLVYMKSCYFVMNVFWIMSLPFERVDMLDRYCFLRVSVLMLVTSIDGYFTTDFNQWLTEYYGSDVRSALNRWLFGFSQHPDWVICVALTRTRKKATFVAMHLYSYVRKLYCKESYQCVTFIQVRINH